MATIVTRAGKGTTLTWAEMDNNLKNLNNDSFISVKDTAFGAVGDGITDDTNAFQSFLNTGGCLFVPSGTYKLSGKGVMGVANTHLLFAPGVIIDYSLVTTPGSPNSPWSNVAFALGFNGSIGSANLLTSNAVSGDISVTVTNGALFAVDDWIQVASNAYYETDTNTKVGEFAQILSINGNILNLYAPLNFPYNTIDTASVKKLSFLENVIIEGKAKFVGAYAGLRQQGAILFRYCRNFRVSDITTLKSDYVGIQTYKSLDGNFTNVRCIEDSSTGGNIGISHVYGSSNMTHTNCYCYDFCHFVDVSGDTTNGGVAMNINATNCHTYEMGGASFNTHPGAGPNINFSHNIVHMKAGLTNLTPTGMVAIRCEGPTLIAIGNYCYNVTGHGIFHQFETTNVYAGIQKQSVIMGNHITASPTNATDFPANNGILVQGYATPGSINGVTITDNVCKGFMAGIAVYANLSNISKVVIANNVYDCLSSASNYGIYLCTYTGFSLTNATISGNISKATGASSNIYLNAIDVNSISDVSISGNTLEGSTFGIRLNNTDNVVESNNVMKSTTTKYLINSGCSNSIVDRRSSTITTHTGSTSYTVTTQDENLIINRAATVTLTLPTPSSWPGRRLTIKTLQNQLVISGSSNVCPIDSATPGTAILPATLGSNVTLVSDGSNWIMMSN